MKDRKLLTEDNHGSYEALKGFISSVCGVGKTVYEGMKKADEYNVRKLLMKLHFTGGGDDENNSPA